jgi:dCMP deaminase
MESKMDLQKWDRRYIDLAKHVSTWSKDPSTKTGAVIVDDKMRLISVGYNGLPVGVEDRPERLEVREIKYKMIVHCERNAIIFAKSSLEGATMYTWPFMSCAVCAGMVIQSGIKRCVAPRNNNPRWVADFELTRVMFKEAGVELVELDGYFLEDGTLIPCCGNHGNQGCK